ncbi:hypothetical protein LR48_Vigan03g127300 [Vigna angularis]|uniref:Putative plant transposon protein domain-containing protein n=1 Tax=Phaseolus angularis TaxID=3914 RepID=A0A0L9U531_PHAAN|nr:hypothetical protein LR48_Vigan03g127300 [Vigna angularis]
MTSSLGKRIKTLDSKDKGTRRKEKQQFYSNKFKTVAYERYFPTVEGRRLLMERKVANIPSLAPQFERELKNRDWGHLATYLTPANIAIIKEFYTNAKALGVEQETYFSYVRGNKVSFDVDTINSFLGTDWEGEKCQYAMSMMEGVDYNDVERTLCVPGGHFQRNNIGAPIHIIRPHLTPLAKYWMAFTHANIQPCSHVSNITIQRAIFLYCVLRGLNINIRQVIANEIQSCARGASNKAPLGHSSLITHLLDGLGQPVPPPQPPSAHPLQPPRAHERAPPPAQEPIHEATPFQMRDIYLSLLDARLAALYMGEKELLRTLTSTFPERQFKSQEDFADRVAWLVDPAQEGGRAEATKASAMDEDTKDEDDEDEEAEEDQDSNDDE